MTFVRSSTPNGKPTNGKPPRGVRGRGKNRQSKVGTIREAFQVAFDLLGGPEGLARWAMSVQQREVTINGKRRIVKVQPNRAAFYEMATKLIPIQQHTHVTGGIGYVGQPMAVAVERRESGPDDVVAALPAPVDDDDWLNVPLQTVDETVTKR